MSKESPASIDNIIGNRIRQTTFEAVLGYSPLEGKYLPPLVGRRSFRKRVAAIAKGESGCIRGGNSKMLEIYGPEGIGKTRSMIEARKIFLEQGDPISYCNFDKEDSIGNPFLHALQEAEGLDADKKQYFALALLMLKISSDLHNYSGLGKNGADDFNKENYELLKKFYGKLFFSPLEASARMLWDLRNDMGRKVSEVLEEVEKPVGIFFDGLPDNLGVDQMELVENYIIAPLLQMDNPGVVFFLTADRPYTHRLPESRRRLILEPLDNFTPEETTTFMKRCRRAMGFKTELPFEDYLYGVTGGHPGAIWACYRKASELSYANRENDLTEEGLLNFLYKDYIRPLVGGHLAPIYPPGIVPFELLSMVRSFDETMMRKIVQTIESDYHNQNDGYYSELMRILRCSQLVVWDNGYRIDPRIAKIIALYYQHHRPDDYLKVNQTALDAYRARLSRPCDNRFLLVRNGLYHMGCLGLSLHKMEGFLRKNIKRAKKYAFNKIVFDEINTQTRQDFIKDKELEGKVGEESMQKLLAVFDEFT